MTITTNKPATTYSRIEVGPNGPAIARERIAKLHAAWLSARDALTAAALQNDSDAIRLSAKALRKAQRCKNLPRAQNGGPRR